MFLRWLFKVFPGEMLRGWSLVRVDLPLWLVLAVASTGMSVAPVSGGGLPSVVLGIVFVVLLVVVVTSKFDAAARGTDVGWDQIFERFVQRGLFLLAATAASLAICLGAAIVVRAAVLILMRNTPALPLATAALGALIYLSLLVRFCFVPFLVVLERRADVDLGTGRLVTLAGPAWPLVASSQLTDSIRWRLVPYLVLLSIGSAVTMLPPLARVPFLLVWQFVQLTAQAVLFQYYRERRGSDLPRKR